MYQDKILYVIRIRGSTTVTSHRHNTRIHPRTIVVMEDSYMVQRYGLSLFSSAHILEHWHGCGHLVGGCFLYVCIVIFFYVGG